MANDNSHSQQTPLHGWSMTGSTDSSHSFWVCMCISVCNCAWPARFVRVFPRACELKKPGGFHGSAWTCGMKSVCLHAKESVNHVEFDTQAGFPNLWALDAPQRMKFKWVLLLRIVSFALYVTAELIWMHLEVNTDLCEQTHSHTVSFQACNNWMANGLYKNQILWKIIHVSCCSISECSLCVLIQTVRQLHIKTRCWLGSWRAFIQKNTTVLVHWGKKSHFHHTLLNYDKVYRQIRCGLLQTCTTFCLNPMH